MDDVRAEIAGLDELDESAARELLAAAAATIPAAPDGAYEIRDGIVAAGLLAEPRKRHPRRWLEGIGGFIIVAAVSFGVRQAIDAIFPGPQSPYAVVSAAVARTAGQSYLATVSFGVQSDASTSNGTPTAESVAYDPARQAGDLLVKTSHGSAEYLRVGEYTYVRSPGGTWTRQSVTAPYPVVPAVLKQYGQADVLFDDPRAVLPLADWASDVWAANPASISGPGWHGTKYLFVAFPVMNPSSGGQGTVTRNGVQQVIKGNFMIINGSVSIDSSGRVRELTENMLPSTSAIAYTLDITYGHYGSSVRVAPPATYRTVP
jgi:hypothetical protein